MLTAVPRVRSKIWPSIAYASLPPAERRHLRAEGGPPALEWLEALLPEESEARARRLADAVIALVSAEALRAEPARLMALLEPREDVLGRLPLARELLRGARETLRAQRHAEDSAALARAEQALAAGRWSEARQLAEGLIVSAADLRDRAHRIASEASAALDEALRRSRYDTAVSAEKALEALAIVGEGERAGVAPAEWAQRRASLEPLLAKAFALDVCQVPHTAPAPEYRLDWTAAATAELRLDGAGAAAYFVIARQEHLFIRRVSLDGGPDTVVTLRVPHFTGEEWCHVEGEVLLVASGPAVLELSTSRWAILAYTTLDAGKRAERVELVVPGTRYLWTSLHEGRTDRLRVSELTRGRVQRELGDGYLSTVIAKGGDGAKVHLTHWKAAGKVHAASGSVECTTPPGVTALALSPDGEGYIGLQPEREATEDDEFDVPLKLVLLDKDGAIRAEASLEEVWSEAIYVLVSSKATGRAYLRARASDDSSWLTALSVRGAQCQVDWRCEVSRFSELVQDARGHHVALVTSSMGRLRLELLGENPPATTGDITSPMQLPSMPPRLFCGNPTHDEELNRLLPGQKSAPEAATRKLVSELIEARRGVPRALAGLAHDLRFFSLPAHAARVLALAREEAPNDPWVGLERADVAAAERQWEQVLERLEGIDMTPLDDAARNHAHHLQGWALYQLGRLEEAAVAMEAGLAVGRGCRLEGWPNWLRLLNGSTENREDSDERRLLESVLRADRLLEEGDAVAAQVALETAQVWRAMEVQLSARLAEAALLRGRLEGEGKYRQRLALCTFLDELRSERLVRAELPLGRRAWSRQRLEQLAQRARAWLTE